MRCGCDSELALALPSLSTLPLEDLTIASFHEEPSNQHFTLPSALDPSAATDHLSLALHTLSQSSRLPHIKFDPIIISPDLYWLVNPTTPPVWPNLRGHQVAFNMTAPDGTWYFVRDPSKPEDKDEGDGDSDDADGETEIDSDPDFDYGSDSFFSTSSSCPDDFDEGREERADGDYPIHSFRDLPLESRINPLLLAMARAAACMPKLRHMSLTSTGGDFEILFYAAGQASS
ncbi:MAG: hypothetical protein Q9221_004943 [Calogaya cf. arnoldii]